MKGEGEGKRFVRSECVVLTQVFMNVGFDEACIHWRCSLAVERRTRNAKVPSSTLGSAFFSNSPAFCQPFCSSPRFLCSYVLAPGWTASSLAPLFHLVLTSVSSARHTHSMHLSGFLRRQRQSGPCLCKMLSLSRRISRGESGYLWGEKVSEQRRGDRGIIAGTAVGARS